MRELVSKINSEAATIQLGGGKKAIERQHEKGRLTARERIAKLCDQAGKQQGGGAPVPQQQGRR